MNVIDIYDYYFFDKPLRRMLNPECKFELCDKSVVYRRVVAEKAGKKQGDGYLDILEYMQYNVSGDISLPSYYSCCMNYSGGHICNAIPIMIGSRLERELIKKLCHDIGIPYGCLYDAKYLHEVYAGTFLVNGTFYYSVFRESNNNKICHNTKSKHRGEETVAYFYDMTYNRGIKLFTGKNGQLRVNDRDGKEISNVTKETLAQLYTECLQHPEHYVLDPHEVAGFFAAVKRQGFSGIDSFKNKIYTNYTIGLNACLDKLHPVVVSHPSWNASLMMGKVNIGISQKLSYSKSKSEVKKQNEQKLRMCSGGMSTGYLVESQRRRNTRKAKKNPNNDDEVVAATATAAAKPTAASLAATSANYESDPTIGGMTETMLGSNEIKTVGLIEKFENCEKNGPSMFNQVTVPYLPFVRMLSVTVQKLQVEHVHAESSKTVPKDAVGFICMKYVGNISTAGKNMLFTDRVRVSYGHVQEVVREIEEGLHLKSGGLVLKDSGAAAAAAATTTTAADTGMRIVINNAVSKFRLTDRRFLFDFMVWIKNTVHPQVCIKPIGTYLCLYFFEGIPFLEYKRNERLYELMSALMVTTTGLKCIESNSMQFNRSELELIRKKVTTTTTTMTTESHVIVSDEDEVNSRFIVDMFKMQNGTQQQQQHCVISSLAKQLDQYTDYTPPSKRSVSVNARKSACANVYFQKAAALIRGFNIFTDPDGYERKLAVRAYKQYGTPVQVTLEQFRFMREDINNCPQPQFGDNIGLETMTKSDLHALKNFYMLRTIFADIDGLNVEDANVIDESLDLCLRFSYSFSLTFVDKTSRGADVLVPPPRDSVRVCGWNDEGEPLAVIFMICTIRTDGSELLSFSHSANDHPTKEEVEEERVEGGGHGSAGSAGLNFPPFRKASVIMSKDGTYHVYILRNDAVLLRSIKRQREEWLKSVNFDPKDPYGTVEEINPYDVLDSLETKVIRFGVQPDGVGESVVTVDFRAHGRVDKYDGIKVVNSFGQKGLALIKDIGPYIAKDSDAAATAEMIPAGVPIQLVMNVCSFISRQPIGQYLQMKKNYFSVSHSAVGEPCLTGFSSVFFTETEPTTKTCLVRLDEMMRSVIVTVGLTSFQNIKTSLDNVYNPRGLLCPPQVRQILSLYRCYGIAYSLAGDSYKPYSTRAEVQSLFELFEECMKGLKKETAARKRNKDQTNKKKCTKRRKITGVEVRNDGNVKQ
jgi:hypothetical protein